MAPRLLAVNSEEMGFDGFCNSYLIRKGGGGGLTAGRLRLGFLAGI